MPRTPACLDAATGALLTLSKQRFCLSQDVSESISDYQLQVYCRQRKIFIFDHFEDVEDKEDCLQFFHSLLVPLEHPLQVEPLNLPLQPRREPWVHAASAAQYDVRVHIHPVVDVHVLDAVEDLLVQLSISSSLAWKFSPLPAVCFPNKLFGIL